MNKARELGSIRRIVKGFNRRSLSGLNRLRGVGRVGSCVFLDRNRDHAGWNNPGMFFQGADIIALRE